MSLNKISINDTTTVNTGIVYDISKAHNGTTYTDLADALSGNNVPPEVREGGMTVRFVSNSDNTYVQYRYMLADVSTAATFTNVDNWQGVDDEPESGSHNLVESGGVFNIAKRIEDVENETGIFFRPEMVIEDDNKTPIHVINEESADFKNLKNNHKTVVTEDQIEPISEIEKKQELRYPDAIVLEDDEENKIIEINGKLSRDAESFQEWDEGDEKIVRIDKDGIKAKAFLDFNGNRLSPVKPIIQSIDKSLGALNNEPLPMEGYAHIVMYGQSLSTGANSYVPVSGVFDTPVSDTYMCGTHPTSPTGTFHQLKAALWNEYPNHGECPVVNAVYSLKKVLNKTSYRNVKLIGTCMGVGGNPISYLSKGSTIYNNRFLVNLTTIKTNVGQEPLCCPAIVWMQGEYDQRIEDTTTVEQYKTAIVQLKNDMQADIMSIYGQSNKPLFFVYQPSKYFTPKYPVVAEALREVAAENDDVILMSAHYMCPPSDGGHLTSNGYRWYGEMIAKAIAKALIKNELYNSVALSSVIKQSDGIILNLDCPNPPLVIDCNTIVRQSNYGFAVYGDGVALSIKVELLSSNQIQINTPNLSSYNVVELEYAGQATNGLGNIRDSDAYISRGLFIDPTAIYTEGASEDSYYPSHRLYYIQKDLSVKNELGESIVGEKYPNYNWMNTFRILL